MRVGLTLAALAAASGLFAFPAGAQDVSSVDDSGIKRVVVYGNDPCPQSAPDEIIVCARRPDDDRYRIPERFRKPDALTGDRESWAYKAEQLEMHGAGGINSCSPVGPGGASGCMQQLIEQARQQRRQERDQERDVP
jgi:hypothetical protein